MSYKCISFADDWNHPQACKAHLNTNFYSSWENIVTVCFSHCLWIASRECVSSWSTPPPPQPRVRREHEHTMSQNGCVCRHSPCPPPAECRCGRPQPVWRNAAVNPSLRDKLSNFYDSCSWYTRNIEMFLWFTQLSRRGIACLAVYRSNTRVIISLVHV